MVLVNFGAVQRLSTKKKLSAKFLWKVTRFANGVPARGKWCYLSWAEVSPSLVGKQFQIRYTCHKIRHKRIILTGFNYIDKQMTLNRENCCIQVNMSAIYWLFSIQIRSKLRYFGSKAIKIRSIYVTHLSLSAILSYLFLTIVYTALYKQTWPWQGN